MNIAIGYSAFQHMTGGNKVAVGSRSLIDYNNQYGTIFDDLKFSFGEGKFEKINDYIFTIENFLSDETCDSLIRKMKEWISHREMHTFGTGKYKFYNDLQYKPLIANILYYHIKDFIPNPYIDIYGGKWSFVRVNYTLPWAMYRKGEKFGFHKDTATFHEDGQDKMTGLICLNDDYEGGETSFTTLYIKPKKGKLLLFDIDLEHMGNEVLEGEKYWLGFELIFKKNI